MDLNHLNVGKLRGYVISFGEAKHIRCIRYLHNGKYYYLITPPCKNFLMGREKSMNYLINDIQTEGDNDKNANDDEILSFITDFGDILNITYSYTDDFYIYVDTQFSIFNNQKRSIQLRFLIPDRAREDFLPDEDSALEYYRSQRELAERIKYFALAGTSSGGSGIIVTSPEDITGDIKTLDIQEAKKSFFVNGKLKVPDQITKKKLEEYISHFTFNPEYFKNKKRFDAALIDTKNTLVFKNVTQLREYNKSLTKKYEPYFTYNENNILLVQPTNTEESASSIISEWEVSGKNIGYGATSSFKGKYQKIVLSPEDSIETVPIVHDKDGGIIVVAADKSIFSVLFLDKIVNTNERVDVSSSASTSYESTKNTTEETSYENEDSDQEISILESENISSHSRSLTSSSEKTKERFYEYHDNSCYLDSLLCVMFKAGSKKYIDLIKNASVDEKYKKLQRILISEAEDHSDMCNNIRNEIVKFLPDIREMSSNDVEESTWSMFEAEVVYDFLSTVFGMDIQYTNLKYYNGHHYFNENFKAPYFMCYDILELSGEPLDTGFDQKRSWDTIISPYIVFYNSNVDRGDCNILVPDLFNKYKLVGVLGLEGVNTSMHQSGKHYVAYVYSDDTWYYYNDIYRVLTPVDGPLENKETGMLYFYELTSTNVQVHLPEPPITFDYDEDKGIITLVVSQSAELTSQQIDYLMKKNFVASGRTYTFQQNVIDKEAHRVLTNSVRNMILRK